MKRYVRLMISGILFLLAAGCNPVSEKCRCASNDLSVSEPLQRLDVVKIPAVGKRPELTAELYGYRENNISHLHRIYFLEATGAEFTRLEEQDLAYRDPEKGTLLLPEAMDWMPFLRLEDINFDGYSDLMLVRTHGFQNIAYTCLLYDPEQQKFQLNRDCSGKLIGSLIYFDPEAKQIICLYHTSAQVIPVTVCRWQKEGLQLDMDQEHKDIL